MVPNPEYEVLVPDVIDCVALDPRNASRYPPLVDAVTVGGTTATGLGGCPYDGGMVDHVVAVTPLARASTA